MLKRFTKAKTIDDTFANDFHPVDYSLPHESTPSKITLPSSLNLGSAAKYVIIGFLFILLLGAIGYTSFLIWQKRKQVSTIPFDQTTTGESKLSQLIPTSSDSAQTSLTPTFSSSSSSVAQISTVPSVTVTPTTSLTATPSQTPTPTPTSAPTTKGGQPIANLTPTPTPTTTPHQSKSTNSNDWVVYKLNDIGWQLQMPESFNPDNQLLRTTITNQGNRVCWTLPDGPQPTASSDQGFPCGFHKFALRVTSDNFKNTQQTNWLDMVDYKLVDNKYEFELSDDKKITIDKGHFQVISQQPEILMLLTNDQNVHHGLLPNNTIGIVARIDHGQYKVLSGLMEKSSQHTQQTLTEVLQTLKKF